MDSEYYRGDQSGGAGAGSVSRVAGRLPGGAGLAPSLGKGSEAPGQGPSRTGPDLDSESERESSLAGCGPRT